MAVDLDKAVLESVRDKIAADVLEHIGEKEKQAILARGVSDALGDWRFKSSIEGAVRSVAVGAVREYLTLPDVQERIRREAIATAEQFFAVLNQSFLLTLVSLLDEDKKKEYEQPRVYKTIRKLLGIEEKSR